jgi:1,4-alpha-glucan branching enzyme
VLEETPGGARVRIGVAPAGSAERVTLLGDFTLWEEVPMERNGAEWAVEVEVPVGTHHFGFMVDDEWYVPEDAPDAVPDEWGRKSLTLVVGDGEP